MLSFELFFEKCEPPVKVLSKYHEDPDVFISFTNSITPSTERTLPRNVDKAPNKKTNRLGLNPRTRYDTPAGIYCYPLKDYWDNIKEYNIPYVKEMPYVWIFKPRNPDKVARTSTYDNGDLSRDLDELDAMFPKYHIKDLLSTSRDHIVQAYPEHYSDPNGSYKSLHIDDHYRKNPLQIFWSVTRNLATLILEDIERAESTKTKHITVWTHILRQFYDGIVDDTGSGTIHSNEPTQAVFWNNRYITPIEMIDRTCSSKKEGGLGTSEWKGTRTETVPQRILKNPKSVALLKKIFTEKIPYDKTKIGKSLVENGGEDILQALEDASEGNVDSLKYTMKYPASVRDLLLDLYIDNRKDDKPFITGSIASGITNDYAARFYDKLLRLSNDPVASNSFLYHYNGGLEELDSETIIHTIKLLEQGNLYNDTLPAVLADLPKGAIADNPKMMSTVMDYLEKLLNDPSKPTDTLVLSILPELKRYQLKGGDTDIFLPIINALTHGTNTYRKAELFSTILDYDLGINEEIGDYVMDNEQKFLHFIGKDPLNKIWFTHTGKELIRDKMSQNETLGKSKMIKPTKARYKENDEIQYYKKIGKGNLRNVLAVITKVLPPHKGQFEYSVLDENGDEDVVPESSISQKIMQKGDNPIRYGSYLEDQEGHVFRAETSEYEENGELYVDVRNKHGHRETKLVSDLVRYDIDNPDDSLHTQIHKAPKVNGLYININEESPRYGKICNVTSVDPQAHEAETQIPSRDGDYNVKYDHLKPFDENDYNATPLTYENVYDLKRDAILRSIGDVINYDSYDEETFPIGTIFGNRSTYTFDSQYPDDKDGPGALKVRVKDMKNLYQTQSPYMNFELLTPKDEPVPESKPKTEEPAPMGSGNPVMFDKGDIIGTSQNNGITSKYIINDVDGNVGDYYIQINNKTPNGKWKQVSANTKVGIKEFQKLLTTSKSIKAYAVNGVLMSGDKADAPDTVEVPNPIFSPGDTFKWIGISDNNDYEWNITDHKVENGKNMYSILVSQNGEVQGNGQPIDLGEDIVKSLADSAGVKKSVNWDYMKI